jgi:hypothetical protein
VDLTEGMDADEGARGCGRARSASRYWDWGHDVWVMAIGLGKYGRAGEEPYF